MVSSLGWPVGRRPGVCRRRVTVRRSGGLVTSREYTIPGRGKAVSCDVGGQQCGGMIRAMHVGWRAVTETGVP